MKIEITHTHIHTEPIAAKCHIDESFKESTVESSDAVTGNVHQFVGIVAGPITLPHWKDSTLRNYDLKMRRFVAACESGR